jgi:hypothetical protein
MSNLLIIDDEEEHRIALVAAIRAIDPTIEIKEWSPRKDDDTDPHARFHQFVRDGKTKFVVTDHDLTKQGPPGLLGDSIVTWCQLLSIPVGDFSRRTVSLLPEEPNQYEIRVPVSDDAASAAFIVSVYRGFNDISRAVSSDNDELASKKSPVAVLTSVLGRPEEEPRFALYGVRLGSSNPSLKEHIRTQPDPQVADKQKILSYVIGHLLLNVVLRYPGPILTAAALAAYTAADLSETNALETLFASARYEGPFGGISPLFWSSDVDELLDELVKTIPGDTATETRGELNRLAIEARLGRPLKRHECDRCGGRNGGFWCPFTKRPVCQLPTCSAASNAWIPQGARVCRIEKEFYNEWSPILGF